MEIAGHKVNNWLVIGGAGGVVLIVYLYKRGSSSSSSSSTNSSSAIDPLTGLPYSEDNTVDPVTGLTYLAEAQQYGSVSAAEAEFSGGTSGYLSTGGLGTYGGTGYVGTAGYPSSTTPLQQVTSFGTNSQWAQAAETYLISLGYDATTVTNALGAYITGSQVTSDQAVVINAAIGAEGYPPVAGSNGNPPGINLGTTTTPPPSGGGGGGTGGGGGGGGTGGGGGGTPPPPPTPTPTRVHEYPAPSGLRVVSKTSSSVTITWDNTNPPATSSTVAVYQMNGKNVHYGTVSLPDATGGRGETTVSGLHPGWQYQIHVWQNGGAVAPPHAATTVTLP